ncbi:hypothetical protein DFH28DRAFT_1048030 [Melampsora americana]|nr:hypothetical protein DFH28DRAFT_1048030 [Melampsora americana]
MPLDMNCLKKPQKPSTSIAREQFIEAVRRDLSFDQNGSKIDMNKSSGQLIAKVNRFNPSMDRMKGMTLIKKGEEDWLWEVEGDPHLIDRRLGGKAKRPRDKASDEEDDQVEDEQEVSNLSQIIHSIEAPNTLPSKDHDTLVPTNTVIRATRSPKRIRTSDPLGLGTLPILSDEAQESGPSRNTRSRASGSFRGRGAKNGVSPTQSRKASGSTSRDPKEKSSSTTSKGKGKSKAVDGSDQVAEITAGIDGFSVFSNHQIDVEPINGFIKMGPVPEKIQMPTMDAADWAEPVGPKLKVGTWLETTLHAGPQAPVDAPKSHAPSSIAGIL